MKTKIIYFLPNFIFGGAGNSIVRLCKFLPKKEFNISVICLGSCYYKKELKNENIEVIEINSTRLIYSVPKLIKILKVYTQMNFKKIIFVSNIHYVNVISLIFLRQFKKLKIIITERTSIDELRTSSNIFELIKKKIIFILVKILYKKADHIVSNSLIVANDLKKICHSKIQVIHPPSLIKINKSKKYKTFGKNIIFVGRLSREKNIFCLLRALKLIKQENFNALIIGDGPQYTEVKEFINKNKLKKKIFLLGKKNNITPYLKDANIFINCSFFEGLPNSVVEAVNLNIPVIASHSRGGSREVILNNKGGTLFSNNDHKKLSKILIKFFVDRKKFIKKAKISKSKVYRFTYKNSFKNYIHLFRNI